METRAYFRTRCPDRRIVTRAVGVDGCAGGWIDASRLGREAVRCERISRFGELLESSPRPQVVPVDVPIGLLARGACQSDVEARRRLGERRSSVFPAPIRPILGAASRAAASAIRDGIEGKRVSCEAWGIVPKITASSSGIRGSSPSWSRTRSRRSGRRPTGSSTSAAGGSRSSAAPWRQRSGPD